MTRYFKRRWEELRGDEYDSWGYSWWYFETDLEGLALRQLERFDFGPVLRYSEDHPEDDFGGLSEVLLDLNEFAPFQIAKEEFELVWNA